MKQAIEEWEGNPNEQDEDLGPEDRRPCSLDNRPNRYIFHITNKFNGKCLNVGSECIKHFFNGNLKGKKVDQLIKEATQLRLLNKIDERIPGIEKTINSWNRYLDNFPILMDAKLANAYLKIGSDVKNLLDKYLSIKDPPDTEIDKSAKSILSLLDKRDAIIIKMKQYIENNKANENIPKREIIKWLEAKSKYRVLKKLKEDGVITWGTACRIEEKGFLNSLVPKLNQALQNIGLNVISVNTDYAYYLLESTKNQIRFLSKHKNLMMYCGWQIFDSKPIEQFTLGNTLKQCKLADEESCYRVLHNLELLSQSLITFNEIDYEFNEIYIFNQNSGLYLKTDLNSFADEFKGLAVGAEDVTVDDLIAYVSNSDGKYYSKAEFEELKEMRSELNKGKF